MGQPGRQYVAFTTVQWTPADKHGLSGKPTTLNFAQSTALYAGGDTAAFNARYPAPLINTVSRTAHLRRQSYAVSHYSNRRSIPLR